jgi:hypothetical protein
VHETLLTNDGLMLSISFSAHFHYLMIEDSASRYKLAVALRFSATISIFLPSSRNPTLYTDEQSHRKCALYCKSRSATCCFQQLPARRRTQITIGKASEPPPVGSHFANTNSPKPRSPRPSSSSRRFFLHFRLYGKAGRDLSTPDFLHALYQLRRASLRF